jgi:catechol 2,3-dioxygenase-like lactoylglutathione lyase family enzyme
MSYQAFKAADALIERYVEDYLANNRAAQVLCALLDNVGIGLRPLIDHITIRTLNVEERAEEFLSAGFIEDLNLGIVEYDNWWAKVYRRPGLPAVFIDQAYDGERGEGCVIPKWVETFGDRQLHHMAVNVADIEKGIAALQKHGIEFAGDITGERGSALRQIFTKPEMRHGMPFTVLELAERRWGYTGFRSLQANTLMESTRVQSYDFQNRPC